jgi:hypothetical protein
MYNTDGINTVAALLKFALLKARDLKEQLDHYKRTAARVVDGSGSETAAGGAGDEDSLRGLDMDTSYHTGVGDDLLMAAEQESKKEVNPRRWWQ